MNKDEKLKIFADNLRNARETAGLSKPAAAAKLNIQPAQYYRYEAGTAEPGLLKVIEMAEMLQTTTEELFYGIKNDISKADYIINKLRGYGIESELIDGDSEHILIYIRDFPPSKESITLMENVLSIAEETTRETMKNAIPSAFFKVLFESQDKDAIDKYLQNAFTKIKDADTSNYQDNSKTKAVVKRKRKTKTPSDPDTE